jgi:hypothetical protein
MKEEGRTTQELEPASVRIAEDRAAKILERAAALDAKRTSEIELDQLREAAEDAGISREAFEEALRESANEPQPAQPGKRGKPARSGSLSPIAGADIAHYAALLTDVLGDDGRIAVTDAIEWRDDEGLTVTVNPTSNRITAAVSAEGRLRTKLMGVVLPAFFPAVLFFLLAFEDEEFALGLLGALFAIAASVGGTWFTHRREQKALRKKAERIRRQLQRLLPPVE